MNALILIDIQKEYFKGGKRELNQPEAATENAKRILEHFREKTSLCFSFNISIARRGRHLFSRARTGLRFIRTYHPFPGNVLWSSMHPTAFTRPA